MFCHEPKVSENLIPFCFPFSLDQPVQSPTISSLDLPFIYTTP